MESLQALCLRAWLRHYPGRSPLPPPHYPGNLRSALIEQLRVHRNLQHLEPMLSADLTQLQLTSSAEVGNDLLHRVIQQCTALEYLDISGCLAVTDGVIAGAAHLPRLHSFLAARTQFGDVSAEAFHRATSLTQLDVSRCRLLSIQAFASLVSSLPSLRRIAALGSPCTHEASLAALPTALTALDWSRSKTRAPAFTLLARLSLLDVALHRTQAGPSALASLSALRRLDIGACSAVDAASVAALVQRCPLLEVFYGPASPQLFTALQSCVHLERLYITPGGVVTDAALVALAPHVPRLQVINLSRCIQVTDAGIAPLAQHCTNLQTLYFSKVSNLTGAGLGALLAALPNLQMVELCTLGHVLQHSFLVDALLARARTLEYLDFSECATAPASAWQRLCGGFPKLAGISLSKTPVDNASLRLLGQRSTGLTMLNICGTTITLPTLASLLTTLPHLQKFYLSSCFNEHSGELDASQLPPRLALQSLFLTAAPNCPDAAVAAILERSGNLHTLMLSSNPHLTDAALAPIPACTPLLQLLDVSDCIGVTATPLRRLKDARVLHTLACARVSGVDDALVASLCANCGILQSLSLQGCTALTPLSVQAIVSRSGPPLETLVMAPGPHLPASVLGTLQHQLTLTRVLRPPP